MSSRLIYLVSPREPSGATWLINCFLELGIKTYRWRSNGISMWVGDSDKYVLNPDENILKKWLPALNDHKSFEFRKDIEVVWTHEWPKKKFEGCRILYFIRDPRDALLSRYKREDPRQSFEEFINFLDHNTLLNRVDNWSLFNRCWMEHENLSFFRFEDYKKYARKTLESILDYIGLDYPSERIEMAIEASTSEKAAESERRYREQNPDDREIINRGGKVGSWKDVEGGGEVVRFIEERAGALMDRFGYAALNVLKESPVSYMPNLERLSFFKDVYLKPPLQEGASDEAFFRDSVVSFAHALDMDVVERSGLRPYESRMLLYSLMEFMRKSDIKIGDTLKDMAAFYGCNGKFKRFFSVFKKRLGRA